MGIQGVYPLRLMENNLFLELFAGGSLNNSDLVTGSTSGELGCEAKYKLLSWFLPVAGGEVTIFSDSYMLDYYAGASFPILNWVSVDLLFSALLTNDKHKIGWAGRINLYF